MKPVKFGLLDLIALPFFLLALFCIFVSIVIGGRWTTYRVWQLLSM